MLVLILHSTKQPAARDFDEQNELSPALVYSIFFSPSGLLPHPCSKAARPLEEEKAGGGGRGEVAGFGLPVRTALHGDMFISTASDDEDDEPKCA